MKNVLWISRHALTGEQLEGLKNFCADDFRVNVWQETVEDLDALAPAIAQADVVAAVLPVHLLAQLVLTGKPVLISRAQRILIPQRGKDPAVLFSHSGWLQVDKLILKLTQV